MFRKLIIAPQVMHQSLLASFRKENSFCDVKIIDKNEFLSSCYLSFEPQGKKELMVTSALDEDTASRIFHLLPFIQTDSDNEKIHGLFELKNKLISLNLLKKKGFLPVLFKHHDVQIYGYSSFDEELKEGLKRLDCHPCYHLENNIPTDLVAIHFSSMRDETLACLNNIAALLDSGHAPANIYIYAPDESYAYYLHEFASSFHFSINTTNPYTYFSQDFICDFLNEYRSSQDLDVALSSLKEHNISPDYLSSLQDIIKEAQDTRFDFESQYAYLISLLKKKHLPSNIVKPAISVIKEPIFVSHAQIFVLGFVEGRFPLSFKDTDYLNDQEKSFLHLNTSLAKGKISAELITDFFSSHNHFYFSYCDHYLTNSFHPSPFIRSWKMEVKNATLPSTYYSRAYANLAYASQCDLWKLFKEKTPDYLVFSSLISLPYNTYDNQFSGAKAYTMSATLHHSYSAIKNYYSCPFKYYLSNALKVDPFEGTFASEIGNLAHHIFQQMYENKDFTFESAYQSALLMSQYSWSEKEKVLLLGLKKYLYKACLAIKAHEKDMDIPTFETEQKIVYQLDNQTYIEGFVDKMIITSGKFLFLVDYKTGQEQFNPKLVKYGLSLQLPTYALLSQNVQPYSNYTLAGLFIQNVISKNFDDDTPDDGLIPEYLKLHGVILSDEEVLNSFDKSFGEAGEKSSFIDKLKMTKGNKFSKTSPVTSEEELTNYAQQAKTLFSEANNKIRHNDFPIHPLMSSSVYSCQYCTYRDLCFLKFEQQNIFVEGGEGDDEDGI